MAATAAELDLVINGDSSGADKALDKTNVSIEKIGKTVTGVGTALLGAAGLSIHSAAGMQQAYANVAAITGQTLPQATEEYSQQVDDLAIRWGKSADDIVAGLYDIVQANYSGSDASKILEAATKGAAAGLTDTTVATDGLTSVLSAYKYGVGDTALSVADLDHINDVMFQTVASGKISYQELNSVLGDNAPLASQLGVSVDEIGAAYAMATNQGVNYAETSTQLNAIMSGLLKPTDALNTALQEHGYQSGLDLVQQKGLAGALQFVKEATGGQADALAELFPNIRATRGLTALLNGDYGTFLDLMKNSSEQIDPVTGKVIKLGATEAALATITSTTTASLSRMWSAIGVGIDRIGEGMLPFVKGFADGLTDLLSVILKLPQPVFDFIGILTALSGAFLFLYGNWMLVGLLPEGFLTGILALAAPLVAIAALIALLAVAWEHNWFGMRNATSAAIGWISGKLAGFIPELQKLKQLFDLVNSGTNPLAAAFWTLGAAFDDLGRKFPILGGAFSALSNAMSVGFAVTKQIGAAYGQLRENMNPLAAIFEAIGGALTNMSGQFGPLSGVVSELGRFFTDLGKAAGDFGDVLQAVMAGNWREALFEARDTVLDLASAFLHLRAVGFVAIFDGLSAAVDYLAAHAGPLSPLFAKISKGLDLLNTVGNRVRANWTALAGGGFNPVTRALLAVSDALNDVSPLFGALSPILDAASDGLRLLAGFIDDAIGAFQNFSRYMNPVSAALLAIGNAFYDLAAQIGGPIGSALNHLGDAFTNVGTAVIAAVDAVKKLLDGDWSGAFDAIKKSVTDLGTAWTDFQKAGIDGLKAVWDALSGVDWGGAFDSILDAAGDALSGAWDALKAGVAAIPWATIGDSIVGAGMWLLNTGEQLIQGLIDGAINRFPTFVAWLNTLGGMVGGAILAADTWLLSEGGQLIQGLIDGAINRFPTFLSWLGSLGLMLLGALADAGGWLLATGEQLIQGLIDGAINRLPTFLSWIGGMEGMLLGGLVDAALWLLSTGELLIQGLIDGAINRFPTFSAWLGSVGSLVLRVLSGAASWLLSAGEQAIQGLIDGVVARFPTFVAWLEGMGGLIAGRVADAASWLVGVGGQLIQGLIDGAINRFPTFSAWLTGLGSTIGGLASGAIGWLKQAGTDIITGFFAAVGDAWSAVANWFQSLGTLIDATVPGLASAIAGKGTELIAGFSGAATAAWDTFTQWISDNINSAKISALIPSISLPSNPLQALIDFATDVQKAFQNVIDKAGELGSSILGRIPVIGGGDKDSGDDSTGMTVKQYSDLAGTMESLQSRISTAVGAITGSLATLNGSFTVATSTAKSSSDLISTTWSTDVPTAFGTAETGVQGHITAIETALGTFAGQATAFGTSVAHNFTASLDTGLGTALTSVSTFVTNASTKLGSFATQAGAFGTSAGSQFSSNLGTFLNIARTNADSVASQIASRYQQLASQLGSAGSSGGSSFNSGISAGLHGALNTAYSIASSIRSALSFSLYSEGLSAGSSFGSGASAGASAYTGTLYSDGVALATALVSGFNSVSKPGSPSRTARKQGGNYGEGLYFGALGWSDKLSSVGATLANQLVQPIDAAFSARSDQSLADIANTGGSTINIYALDSDELLMVLNGVRRSNSYIDTMQTNSRAGIVGGGVQLGR